MNCDHDGISDRSHEHEIAKKQRYCCGVRGRHREGFSNWRDRFSDCEAVVPAGVAVFPTGGAGVVLLSRQLDCLGGKGFMIFGIGYV